MTTREPLLTDIEKQLKSIFDFEKKDVRKILFVEVATFIKSKLLNEPDLSDDEIKWIKYMCNYMLNLFDDPYGYEDYYSVDDEAVLEGFIFEIGTEDSNSFTFSCAKIGFNLENELYRKVKLYAQKYVTYHRDFKREMKFEFDSLMNEIKQGK